ncbi:MAG: hypothetical protein ACOYYU_19725 [Chloroflexota bacterium]
MRTSSSQKTVSMLLLSLCLAFIILMGCKSTDDINVSNTDKPSFFPTLTITSTPTKPCPTILINTPSALDNTPILVITLVEKETGKSKWEYTTESFELISKVYPNIAEPGDRFIYYLLGPRISDFHGAFISSQEVGSAGFKPDIPATPTHEPTVTPTVAPLATIDNTFFRIATKNAADATQTAILATATHSEFINNCAMGAWATQYAAVATEWAVTREASVTLLSAKTRWFYAP